jgi:hypothetical protein
MPYKLTIEAVAVWSEFDPRTQASDPSVARPSLRSQRRDRTALIVEYIGDIGQQSIYQRRAIDQHP